jgi:hypothetical protein
VSECLLVARPQAAVEVRTLAEPDYRFIVALASGSTLTEAAAAGGTGFDVGVQFTFLLNLSIITGLAP